MAALATSYGKSESGASRRVLCKQLWIPPLETTKPSLNYGGSLPVLYTNDPEAAHRWTDTHIPEIDRPVVVGWDMEVRFVFEGRQRDGLATGPTHASFVPFFRVPDSSTYLPTYLVVTEFAMAQDNLRGSFDCSNFGG